MALPNPLFFYESPLQQVIFDKTTGSPLAGGIITYYTDSSMSTRKNVYAQSNSPAGTFTNIGSQLVLSGIGSFVDIAGNNFVPFLFPYTGTPSAPGVFESYFIYVQDSNLGFQFSVSDWPPNQFNDSTSSVGNFTSENQITNPQFAETLFSPAVTAVITTPAAPTITPIAPGWFINTTGIGTVTLTQNNLTADDETNPPYSLSIVTAGAITSFTIYQRIFNSPRLFATGVVSGYMEAASLAPSSVLLTMTFAPSTGGSSTPVPTLIAQGSTLNTGAYNKINGAAAISGPVNLESPATGYVDLIITPGVPIFNITLTSIQLIPVLTASDVLIYNEVSVPLQKSLNSSYWLPKLNDKPIPSYLVGWDWGLNPFQAQGTGAFGPNAYGANTAYYIADQTILFQSVTSGFASALTGNNLVLTCQSDSSGAIIQYVSPLIVAELLSQRMSVQINCSTNNATPVIATVSLWWTAGVIPTITSGGSYASLFSAVSAAGVPTAIAGWTQVPNTYPTQSFTIPSALSPFSFSGFDATAQASVSTAVNFAIAITFGTMTAAKTLSLNYCSLVGGDIATRPAPQTPSQVLADCQYYYESTYDSGVTPATSSSPGRETLWMQASTSGGNTSVLAVPFEIKYKTIKITAPTDLTFYDGTSVDNMLVNCYGNGSYGTPAQVTVSSFWSSLNQGYKSISYAPKSASSMNTQTISATAAQGIVEFHWIADSRLGVI